MKPATKFTEGFGCEGEPALPPGVGRLFFEDAQEPATLQAL
jgi:hypothetical protein